MPKKISKAKLIATLRPFAEYGVVYGERHKPDGSVWDQVPDDKVALLGTFEGHRITVGELRAASRLYYANDGNPLVPEQIK